MRTTEKTGLGPAAPRKLGPAAPRKPAMHPLDAWLRRELQTLYPGSAGEPLPRDMAELASRLEAVLSRTDDREGALDGQDSGGRADAEQ